MEKVKLSHSVEVVSGSSSTTMDFTADKYNLIDLNLTVLVRWVIKQSEGKLGEKELGRWQ